MSKVFDTNKDYKYGFTTDIESFKAPKGLSEETIKFISKEKKLDTLSEFLSFNLKEAREKFEKEYLKAQIERFGGNISRTSSFIKMERSALHRKIKTLDIESNRH